MTFFQQSFGFTSVICVYNYIVYIKKTVLPDLIDLTVVTRDIGKVLVISPTAQDITFFDKVLTFKPLNAKVPPIPEVFYGRLIFNRGPKKCGNRPYVYVWMRVRVSQTASEKRRLAHHFFDVSSYTITYT